MLPHRNVKRWMPTLLTFTLLIGGIVSFNGCTTKLPPSVDDDRGCYIAVVTPDLLRVVQVWEPNAHVGDLLISRACDENMTNMILNSAQRMSHEETK